MSHTAVKLMVLTLAIAGAACSGAIPRQSIPDYSHFSHSWTTPQVTLYWDCTPVEPGFLRIDGVGVNLWEPVPPRFLELIANVVDAQSRVLSRTQGSAEGVELLKNFPAPFRLTLQEQAGEARVDLAYRYQYWDDSFEGFARWIPAYATGRVLDACSQGGRQTLRRPPKVPHLRRRREHGCADRVTRRGARDPLSTRELPHAPLP